MYKGPNVVCTKMGADSLAENNRKCPRIHLPNLSAQAQKLWISMKKGYSVSLGSLHKLHLHLGVGRTVRKMLNLIHKKCKLGGMYVVECQIMQT